MAGYKPQRKLYKLKFTDEEYEGLEVLASSVSMGTMLELQSLQDRLSSKISSEETAAVISKMIEIFCRAVKSWNLTGDDEQLLPITVESLHDQEPSFVMALIKGWSETVAGVPVPLAGGSDSGETSQEASLGLGNASQSLES